MVDEILINTSTLLNSSIFISAIFNKKVIMNVYIFSFLVAACLLKSGETRQMLMDSAIKSELDEMIQSTKVRFFYIHKLTF